MENQADNFANGEDLMDECLESFESPRQKVTEMRTIIESFEAQLRTLLEKTEKRDKRINKMQSEIDSLWREISPLTVPTSKLVNLKEFLKCDVIIIRKHFARFLRKIFNFKITQKLENFNYFFNKILEKLIKKLEGKDFKHSVYYDNRNY